VTYHRRFLNEAITGTIEFKLVRLKVHTMELSIIRKEMTGVGASAFSETDTLAKFELMDGLPVKAEVVPLRWYMGGIDLTPTFKTVDNKFSVKFAALFNARRHVSSRFLQILCQLGPHRRARAKVRLAPPAMHLSNTPAMHLSNIPHRYFKQQEIHLFRSKLGTNDIKQ
jgi:hypothetical protein